MIHHDQVLKFLRAVRSSPPYSEKAKKDIFAMIRQLGPASLFCSFSSAETQWIHQLRILGKIVDNKTYTDAQFENLNWEEKNRLIQCDPVTCARHLDFQVHKFLQNFLLSNTAPIGKIQTGSIGLSFNKENHLISYSYVNMARKYSYIWCKF